jgi:hypothetical protein
LHRVVYYRTMPEYDIPGMKRVVNKNFAFVVVFRTTDTPINRG